MSLRRVLFSILLIFLSSSLLEAKPSSERRLIGLEWEAIEDAKRYQIEVRRFKKSDSLTKPKIFKVKKASWKAKVRPGLYQLRLRSVDDRGVPGEWSEPVKVSAKTPAPKLIFPKENFVIKSKNEDEQEIKFKWKKQASADEYLIEIKDNQSNKVIFSKEVSKNKYDIDLLVAKEYSWRVTTIMKNGEKGEETDFKNSFKIIGKKLNTPTIEKPHTEFVSQIKWEKPEKAENFKYRISQKQKNGKWKVIESQKNITESVAEFSQKHPAGTYKIDVSASATLRIPSDSDTHIFKVRGDRSPAAVYREEKRISLEKSTNLYLIASYLITNINYKGQIQNLGLTYGPEFDALGGTGRLGAGYFFSDSQFGLMGIADMSGFKIGGENKTFTSIELHGSWRTYFNITQLRVSAGLYLKDLPVSISNPIDNTSFVDTISYDGLHVGFDLWHPLSRKLGAQVNFRVYKPMSGAAPSIYEISKPMSMQFGLLGSYRLTQKIMGFAGYAFRSDKGGYISTDGQSEGLYGTQNDFSISGHYFNLYLEWGF